MYSICHHVILKAVWSQVDTDLMMQSLLWIGADICLCACRIHSVGLRKSSVWWNVVICQQTASSKVALIFWTKNHLICHKTKESKKFSTFTGGKRINCSYLLQKLKSNDILFKTFLSIPYTGATSGVAKICSVSCEKVVIQVPSPLSLHTSGEIYKHFILQIT